MTIASISFTDATGVAVVTNTRIVPGDRFTNWNPDAMPIQASSVGLGTGLIESFVFREDYLVSFELRDIPKTELDKLLRLETHLLDGYLVALASDNIMISTYAICALAPDEKPDISFTDKTRESYTLSLRLLAVDSATVPGDEPFYPPGA